MQVGEHDEVERRHRIRIDHVPENDLDRLAQRQRFVHHDIETEPEKPTDSAQEANGNTVSQPRGHLGSFRRRSEKHGELFGGPGEDLGVGGSVGRLRRVSDHVVFGTKATAFGGRTGQERRVSSGQGTCAAVREPYLCGVIQSSTNRDGRCKEIEGWERGINSRSS